MATDTSKTAGVVTELRLASREAQARVSFDDAISNVVCLRPADRATLLDDFEDELRRLQRLHRLGLTRVVDLLDQEAA